VAIDITGLGFPGPARVEEYRFDQDHNSPFKLARSLRDRPAAMGAPDRARLAEVMRALEGSDRAAQREALSTLQKLDSAGRQAVLPVILKLAGPEQDLDIQERASDALKTLFAPTAYSRAEVEQIQKLCECHRVDVSAAGGLDPKSKATGRTEAESGADGRLRVTTHLAGNGCVFLKIEPKE
jgi:hypothetical protein